MKEYKITIALFIIVIIVFAVVFMPVYVPFWQFTTQDIVTLLISLFLAAAFIERAVEVLIIVWREKDKQKIQNTIEAEAKKSEDAAKGRTKEITDIERKARLELNEYKADTKSIAMPTAFVLGVTVSVLGIRAVQPLVDPAVFKTLTSLQKSLFYGIDALITGALLSGGSKGIHEIIEAFLNTVEKYRENLKGK